MALGAAFAALACDEPDPTADSPALIWCEAVCSRAASCGYRNLSCESNCVSQRPGLANISRSGASALAPCLERLSCGAFEGDDERWANEMDACWERARDALAPTKSARAFCEPYAAVWFSCGWLFPLDECASIYGMWSDSVLERVLACRSSSCEQLDACVDGVFERL